MRQDRFCRHVLPIFRQDCIACHRPNVQNNDLRSDSKGGVTRVCRWKSKSLAMAQRTPRRTSKVSSSASLRENCFPCLLRQARSSEGVTRVCKATAEKDSRECSRGFARYVRIGRWSGPSLGALGLTGFQAELLLSASNIAVFSIPAVIISDGIVSHLHPRGEADAPGLHLKAGDFVILHHDVARRFGPQNPTAEINAAL